MNDKSAEQVMAQALSLGLKDAGRALYRFAFKLLIAWIIGYYVFSFVAGQFEMGFDDTDDKLSGERSGMALHIDNRTGCHYLASSAGSLTPRLDKSGRQICEN